jgi:glycosyltransferase involved in cell wall biosynthesis
MMKQKVLIFHPALAPYRIDFFNCLSKKFKTSFYFYLPNLVDQKFDQDKLKSKCEFNVQYLEKGFECFGRSVRFGIRKTIRNEKPDIVICSEFNAVTILTYLYKRIYHKKYKLYTICDDSLDNASKRKNYRAVLRNFISKNIDGIILPSQEVCDWFKDHISKNLNTLILPVIHNEQIFRKELEQSLAAANDYILSENLEGKKMILYVGRLTAVKNLFFLLRVIARIKDENYRLVIVGDGILSRKLKSSAKKLGILEKVIFTGRKEGSALLAWYNVADIFVLPSTDEQFGAVVNEALLAGCYILCSKRAGASSIINSGNGRVFDPNNDDELLSFINEKLNQIAPIRIGKAQLRESKMPFTFTSILDTFLMQLEK